MHYTRIKVCGITREADAELALQLGVDALGFVFHDPSPRAVTRQQVQTIAAVLPPFVTRVGLFVNAEADVVQRVVDSGCLDMLQFHGEESPEYCAGFALPWMKALRMAPDADPAAVAQSYAGARALLLDAWQPGVHGGTGHRFDWSRAGGAGLSLPLVLAGGLNAENVAAAIQLVAPAAVDVSSGVESGPGHKQASKLKAFVAAVRGADQSGER